MRTSRVVSVASCLSTVTLPRRLTSWPSTPIADVMSSRLSSGVWMLTAMTTSAPHAARATSIGRLFDTPPSTSIRPSISTGVTPPGIAMLARIARASGP